MGFTKSKSSRGILIKEHNYTTSSSAQHKILILSRTHGIKLSPLGSLPSFSTYTWFIPSEEKIPRVTSCECELFASTKSLFHVIT